MTVLEVLEMVSSASIDSYFELVVNLLKSFTSLCQTINISPNHFEMVSQVGWLRCRGLLQAAFSI